MSHTFAHPIEIGALTHQSGIRLTGRPDGVRGSSN